LRQCGVVGYAAVDEGEALALDRGQHGRDGGAGQHCAERVSGREEYLFAAEQVRRDDVHRGGRVFEVAVRQVVFGEAAEVAVGAPRRPGPGQGEEVAERIEGEHLLAAQSPPGVGQDFERLAPVPWPAT